MFKKMHFSYNFRLIINYFLFFIFLVLSFIMIYNSLDIKKEENIKYNEKGSINYKVCLKENNFYENSCIDNNMSYISGLIKNIPLYFDYNFKVNKSSNIIVKYEVSCNLVISNIENSLIYFNKNYILVPLTESIYHNNSYNLVNNDIIIDYDYYNNIASNFKSEFGVDTKSYLEVIYTVYNEINGNIISPSVSSINIPLSQKSIDINMKSNDLLNSGNQKSFKYSISLVNIIYFSLGLISFLCSFIFLIKGIRLSLLVLSTKNEYDKYINKILKEYDRLIVETTSIPNFNDYNVILIKKFSELLDVRDNLHLPIMYYVVVKHHKSYLYILNNNNLYLLTLKSVDFCKERVK